MRPVSQSSLFSRLLPYLQEEGRLYRKITHVFAKEAIGGEEIETSTSDGIETSNRARKGDYLVKNKTGAGEMYIVPPEKFHKKYVFLQKAGDGFSEYRPTGQVIALELTPSMLAELGLFAPFYFEAPWGEEMVAKLGDFLAVPVDRKEVYRIARKEFFETYEPED